MAPFIAAALVAMSQLPYFVLDAFCGNGFAGDPLDGEVTIVGHAPVMNSTSSIQKSKARPLVNSGYLPSDG